MTASPKWLETVTHGASDTEIATKLEVSRATVNRWRRRGMVDPEAAIKLARLYGSDPVLALMATGWLSRADLNDDMFRNVVKLAPAHMLVAELHHRYQTGTGSSSPFD
jgi:plasmid maintenance system antidote protein VapI